MPEFAYKVRAPGGNVLSGVLSVNDQRAAVDKLRAQRYIILEIKEAKKNILDTLKAINPLKPSVGSKDLVLFSRQLSTLVSAGVPLVQGLSILHEQIESKIFKVVVGKIREDIESGLSIAEALGRHPDAFSTLFVSMVKAGEVGGILDVILERLSAYLEAAENLRSKVKGALVYPLVVSLIAALVTLFLLIFVIPSFKTIFTGFGENLPLPTQVLITISDNLLRFWYLIPVFPTAIGIAVMQWHKTPQGQLLIDKGILKFPMFGELLRKVAVAKFTRTLGTLVKSGVPILQALETVAKTAGNKVIEDAIMKARESIREGERIADPLKKSAVFPAMVIQMISVGEETGNLDTMLSKIADFYDQEVDIAVKSLTSLIEPIVIVVMGLVIGTIVIAMFLPIFELGSLASKG